MRDASLADSSDDDRERAIVAAIDGAIVPAAAESRVRLVQTNRHSRVRMSCAWSWPLIPVTVRGCRIVLESLLSVASATVPASPRMRDAAPTVLPAAQSWRPMPLVRAPSERGGQRVSRRPVLPPKQHREWRCADDHRAEARFVAVAWLSLCFVVVSLHAPSTWRAGRRRCVRSWLCLGEGRSASPVQALRGERTPSLLPSIQRSARSSALRVLPPARSSGNNQTRTHTTEGNTHLQLHLSRTDSHTKHCGAVESGDPQRARESKQK